jgi:hypothetical protein
MMQRYNMKRMTYTVGFQRINEWSSAPVHFEPESLQYDPSTRASWRTASPRCSIPRPAGLPDRGPLAPPLPVDTLIKLNEIQVKMALGLESKRGALADLGDEFPDEKIQEIFEELVQDAKEQALWI